MHPELVHCVFPLPPLSRAEKHSAAQADEYRRATAARDSKEQAVIGINRSGVAARIANQDRFHMHAQQSRGGLGIAQLATERGGDSICVRRVGRCDGDEDANAGGDEGEGDCLDVHAQSGGNCLSNALLRVAIVVVNAACNGECKVDAPGKQERWRGRW